MTIETLGINSDRFSLNWVSAAEATRFVQVITDFTSRIRDLGPLGKEEGLHRGMLSRKIEAARMALEGSRMRMAFARQAKQIKNEGTHGELMSEEKLNATLKDEINLYETYIFLREKERSAEELSALMDLPADHVSSYVDKLRKKKIWDGTLVQTEQP